MELKFSKIFSFIWKLLWWYSKNTKFYGMVENRLFYNSNTFNFYSIFILYGTLVNGKTWAYITIKKKNSKINFYQ